MLESRRYKELPVVPSGVTLFVCSFLKRPALEYATGCGLCSPILLPVLHLVLLYWFPREQAAKWPWLARITLWGRRSKECYHICKVQHLRPAEIVRVSCMDQAFLDRFGQASVCEVHQLKEVIVAIWELLQSSMNWATRAAGLGLPKRA